MIYHTFHELIRAYFEQHLKGKASYATRVREAKWLLTLQAAPTRDEIKKRHKAKGHGDFLPGAAGANNELTLLRTIFRYGIEENLWDGHDPTVGVKPWKTARRKRMSKVYELRKLLEHFDCASTEHEVRERALFGLMLFTGCRPSEARKAKIQNITPYGEMGSWIKGQTKTGEDQDIPLPSQYMPWLAAWKAIRTFTTADGYPNPYVFPGQAPGQLMAEDTVCKMWIRLRNQLGLTGLWNYDLRRTLACTMGNELKYDAFTIRAILNHSDRSALGHYYFKTFDSLTEPIQKYADWLWALKQLPPPVASSFDARVQVALSRRERDVLDLFAQHRTVAQIAKALTLKPQVVDSYRTRLMAKLQLTTTDELHRYAMTHQANGVSAPAPQTPLPVTALPPLAPAMTAPTPMIYPSRRELEREEWPG